MIKEILNFGICSPKAVLAVQLSKHNDITWQNDDNYLLPTVSHAVTCFHEDFTLIIFFLLNKTEKLENISAVPLVVDS